MNKIYKLIWSKTKNCWVVASELAKGHGKDKSRIKNSLLAVFVMSALLAGGVADVQALTQQEKEEVAKYLLDKIAHGGEIPGVDASRGSTNFPDAIAYRIQYFNEIAPAISDQMIKKGLTRQYFAVRPDYIEPGRDYLNRYGEVNSENKASWTNVNNDGAFGAHSMALGYRAFSEAKNGVAIGRSALAGIQKEQRQLRW
ncbi:MAG: ESPR domain-containing protein [Dialister sp.]